MIIISPVCLSPHWVHAINQSLLLLRIQIQSILSLNWITLCILVFAGDVYREAKYIVGPRAVYRQDDHNTYHFRQELVQCVFLIFMLPSPLKNGAGGILYRVCPSVSEWVCASSKHCEHHILKPNEDNFTQFWSHIYLGLQMCWLYGFWDQRSQNPYNQHSRQWPERPSDYNIFVNIWAYFDQN